MNIQLPYSGRIMGWLPNHDPIELHRWPSSGKPDIKMINAMLREMSPLWTLILEKPTPKNHFVGQQRFGPPPATKHHDAFTLRNWRT